MQSRGLRTSGKRTLLMLLFCLLLPVPAFANGAMSLALATFAWGPWLAYVVVTICYEAAAMGKWLGLPFKSALRYSLSANLVTAILGALFSGVISYGFLGIFGSVLSPNPFWQTVFVFTLYGIGSALIEAMYWSIAARKQSASVRSRNSYAGSLLVHLIGVPIGLAILLLPARPYVGLEMQVNAQRHLWLGREIPKVLQLYMTEHQAVPTARNYGEMLEALRPTMKRYAEDHTYSRLDQYARDPNLWAVAYDANYHRFDTGEMRREPFMEWNAALSGRKLLSDTAPAREDTYSDVWLIRCRTVYGVKGYILNLPYGGLSQTTDPHQLGYSDAVSPGH